MQPVPFALPDIGQEEIDHVVTCLKSGWLTSGPVAHRFEEDFATFLGGGVQAVAVNSATSGLQLALEAVGVGPGDEVITTPYTFSSTGMSVIHRGATPVFVDIDPATFNLDPARIEAAVTPKTKAILPVHFGGLACDLTAIRAIADRHKLKIVDDAAHALPTSHRGTPVGAHPAADATVFSFYATKTITTGEGGMIVTRSQAVADRCRIMRLHGISRDAFKRHSAAEAKWYYEVVAPGHKFNLPDIAAAIGVEQLKKAAAFHARRRQISDRYRQGMKGLPVILPPAAPQGDQHSWHLFVIRLADDAPLSRDDFITRMEKEWGISCSVHFIPLPLHPYWQEHGGLKPGDYANAVDAYRRAVSLPIYTKMSDEQVERVISAAAALLS